MKKNPSSPHQELPENWTLARLDEIAEVRLGRQRSPKRAFGDHMRPYMRAGNVTWQGVNTDDVKSMDFTPKEAETYELRYGDILLSEASGSAHEVGKPAFWRDEVPGACFQNTLIRVRTETALARYLHRHFYKDALTGAFARASRGVGIHHLGAQALSEWQVKVPPKQEQGRIIDALDSYLSRLDAAVEGLKRVQANLKRYRASVLKAAVEGRLVPTEAELARQEGHEYEPASVLLGRILKERRRRWEEAELAKLKAKGSVPKDDKWKAKYKEPAPPDTSDLPELPEGWCWASVEQLAAQESYALAIGPFGSNLKVSDYREAGVPLVFVRNIRSGNFALETATFVSVEKAQELRAHQIRGGDILVTKMGEPPGETCLYPVNAPPAVITADCIKVRAHAYLPSPQFLVTALRSPPVQDQISRITQGVAQRKVSLGRFKGVALPLAPAAEMVRLHAEIERLETITSASAVDAHNAVKKTERLRQSILRWAFEGRLVDQDADDEPAEALLARIREERSASSGAGKAPKRASAARKGTGPAPAPKDKKKAASRAKKTAP